MFSTLLSTETLASYSMVEPGVLLFGALLVLFGASAVFAIQLKSDARGAHTLFVLQFLSFLCLLGIAFIDLSGLGAPLRALGTTGDLSETLATHRALLVQVPLMLTFTNLLVLLVFHGHMHEPFSHAYRRFARAGVFISFACLLLIAFESLI